MKPLVLHEFLSVAETVREWQLPDGELRVKGMSIDSRTIQPGELFIALRGERFDGHRFVGAARQAGAVAAVVAKDQAAEFREKNIPLVIAENTLDFLQEFAGWYRRQFRIPVLALTGSAGKTTTKEMLVAVLGKKFNVHATAGNQNNQIGVPLTLLGIEEETEVVVAELGTNHPGEIARLTAIVQPDRALITNIGSGHIGFFGSREAIYQEKIALFEGVQPGGLIYLNTDDDFLRRYYRQDVTIRRVGSGKDADFRGKIVETDRMGRIAFTVNDSEPLRVGIPGKHQFLNALLTTAVALDLEVPLETIRQALKTLQPPDKRMELLQQDGIVFINDSYNASPEAMRAAIEFLLDFPVNGNGRKILVLGDMLELGGQSETIHREIGRFLREKAVDYVFLYGEFSRLILEELEALPRWKGRVAWFESHQEIARRLQTLLQPGDVVCLKGARGMAMEKVLEHLNLGGAHAV